MTDIQYHLKIIQQLVAARLNDHDISDINEELTLLLPDSYGVASGRVRNENGQWSRHLPLVIYDKTMAGREYPRHNPTVDINEVLAVASYAPSHTRKLLVSDLRDIASVKTLKSGSRQSQKQLTAPTNRIPKHRIPVAMIITRYLDGFNPDREADYIWLHEIISKRALQVAPDFIHLTAQNVLYRNPLLLEHLPLTGYDMGLSRTPRLAKPRTCYVCKHRFYRTHFFYEKLCVHCGDISYKKRIDRVDLSERTAVVTGGRVKIGYETVLRLLRAGAQVIVTTRFPHDAALRYASETDFETWRNRLRIYQLDMRNPVTVQQFVADLYDTLPHLDILVNNAAQTVRRPQAYYAHLLEGEAHALPEPLQPLVLNSNSGQ
ncbi:MAG: SDR family NAD(P)-dependent oxidoreductase, partial [Chloroflexota bacterium]